MLPGVFNWLCHLARQHLLRSCKAACFLPGVPQIKMARLYIDADMQSLPRLAPVADAFEIDGLALSLTHLGRGRSDVNDVLARLKPAGHAPASDPMRFTLYNLLLSDGQLETRAGGRPPDLSAALLHPRLPPGRRWRSGTTSLPGVFCPAGSFLGAQKNAPADTKWTPRAELNLAMP